MVEEKRRGRPPGSKNRPKEEPMPITPVEPPSEADEPGFLEHIDAMVQSGLLEEMTDENRADLEDLLASQYAENTDGVSGQDRESYTVATKPTRDKFITMRGGLYLPVRQRVIWMRGEPEQHPDWLIQTDVLRMEPGSYTGTKTVYLGGQNQEVPDVKGGYAHVRAQVLTRLSNGKAGPVIGEGNAFERSEVFHDFVEKAETAAIGRALAAAGYGTEAAFEEGDSIADAPYRVDQTLTGRRQIDGPPAEIKIEASAVPGVKQGGRQAQATQPQLAAIRDVARELMLSPSKLQEVVRTALNASDIDPEFYNDDVPDNPDGANDVMGYLAGLSFEDCGKVVQALMNMKPEGGS